MTRPSYDPMRAPAPTFPRHRFQRVADDDRVNEVAAAYDALDYEGRVRFARAVASAPDERLVELADEITATRAEQTPTEPVPPSDPTAPAVNQAAAQQAPPPDTASPDSPAPAPTPPPLPVPADQLPQLKVPELQAVAEQVGVAKTGTKAELVDRITAATGEQPAITPEQVAADAAASTDPGGGATAPVDAPAADPAPADSAPAEPGGPQVQAADPTSAPQTAPATGPGPDTPATAPAPDSGQTAAPATPAAPADGTPTDGGTAQ